MHDGGYRKLRMHVPRQPLSPQRPWLIAGFVLVFILLIIAAYGYFTDKTRTATPNRQKMKDTGSHMFYHETTRTYYACPILTRLV